ncbi:4'-phosphopantetheinyl transferase superfamily protein [Paucisalibacillus sp. EB02]|uniref:4'-phosphopantetheinyl transferase family protein n=1 Tax=Paucisalibacillus sp. EB02 TaxID=1347087 RepID=UPI0005AA9BAA|nr:4'-phosphopantetheinyl transferase superfamily protein [Paucisalibacillus sp. EB02]
MLKVYAVKIPEEINEEDYQVLLSFTSIEKREKIKKVKHKQSLYQTLIGDIVIRLIILENKIRLSNEEIDFEYNRFGKPRLKNESSFMYNISHSNEWVVCVVDSCQVGIDIEYKKPIELRYFEKVFSLEELIDIRSKNPFNQQEYFYDLWTLKESYIKMIGEGFSYPVSSLTVKKNSLVDIQLVNSINNSNPYFKQYNIDPNYTLSVCAEKEDFPKEVVIWSFSRILEILAFSNTNL